MDCTRAAQGISLPDRQKMALLEAFKRLSGILVMQDFEGFFG